MIARRQTSFFFLPKCVLSSKLHSPVCHMARSLIASSTEADVTFAVRVLELLLSVMHTLQRC